MKIGRTHLQDAVPLTLGQEFSGYVAQLEADIERIEQALPRSLRAGDRRHRGRHGLNAPAGFGERVAGKIAEITGLPFVRARTSSRRSPAHDGSCS